MNKHVIKMEKKLLLLLIVLLVIGGCTYDIQESQENISEQQNETIIENVNETQNESINDTVMNDSFSDEIKVEGLYKNKTSKNFIWYEFKLSNEDSLIVWLNNEELYNSKVDSKEDMKGKLEGYPQRYNTLKVKYSDTPDNQALLIDMKLNNQTSMFSWSQFNSSGEFEVPLEFIDESIED